MSVSGPSHTIELESAASTDELQPKAHPATLLGATPLKHSGRKGPVPKRRYQEGTLRKENGRYYSFFYRDRKMPDGNTRSVKERFDHGKVGAISELSARREHDRLRQQINRERGSVPPAPHGESFADAASSTSKALRRICPVQLFGNGNHTCGSICFRDSVQRR